ncbi:MAG: NYN domain-containing protein [Anaerolineales bacterium]
MRLANPPPGQTKYVEVIKTEEKGSDVNLAVNLLNDGYQGKYQLATIVTNDSDLLSAVQIVQKDLGLKVGILNPQKHPSKERRFNSQVQLYRLE